ncbi:protein arginine N-methyltransferase 7 [Topomyia yanbarensis]|uniref:protein arginine N-methyltransferase 7 n=1 Tax=Topomyia yanbarensis TaxID=2498891 RepID=UPI00273BAA07|nr:protein arginine N-methyltransferase 7 [Topomyia yanbarensis]
MNPEPGNFSDVDSDDGGFDLQQEIARSAFADMCHDWERNQKYDRALQVTIERLHGDGKEAHVLDIGTGSGLLSMMAVRAGADSVTACEAFRPMADCAERVIAANAKVTNRIRLVKKKSTEMKVGPGQDLERRANVLVTELFDTELIGEGALATYRHALSKLLEPGCCVIPHSATIYGQIVESPTAMSWQVPKALSNADGDVLLRTPNDVDDCRGSAAVFDVQLSQLPLGSFTALSEPIPVFEFNWSDKDGLVNKRHSRKLIKIKHSGVPQAVFMWWDLKMDLEEKILLSCAPFWAHPDYEVLRKNSIATKTPHQNLIPWRDHWMQAIYFLPKQKTALIKGQDVNLDAYHDEFSLWFGIDQPDLDPPHCSCGLHFAYSRSRIGQINDGARNKRILNYLEEILNKNSVVLVLGDGSLLGLGLVAIGVQKVILLETSQISKECMQKYASFNGLDSVSIISSVDQLTDDVTHVFAEPFFGTAILPWDNAIQFGVQLDLIKSKLSSSVTVIPSSFSIHAVPVQFMDLQKICMPLGRCEGFDLSIMDKMIEEHSNLTDSPVEAQPLWEYPCFAVGLPTKLIHVSLAEKFESSNLCQGTMDITLDDVLTECNGVALWADWHMDKTDRPKTIISTGPLTPLGEQLAERTDAIKWNANWRQGVHLLKKSILGKTISWSVQFHRQLEKCIFSFE